MTESELFERARAAALNDIEQQYQNITPFRMEDQGRIVGHYESIDEALASPECMTGFAILDNKRNRWEVYDYEGEFYAG